MSAAPSARRIKSPTIGLSLAPGNAPILGRAAFFRTPRPGTRRTAARRRRNFYWIVAPNMERERAREAPAAAPSRHNVARRLAKGVGGLAAPEGRGVKRSFCIRLERILDESPYHALGRRGARNEPCLRLRCSARADREGETRRARAGRSCARRAGGARRPAR